MFFLSPKTNVFSSPKIHVFQKTLAFPNHLFSKNFLKNKCFSKVYLSKVYFCKNCPTCASSKLCEFIVLLLFKGSLRRLGIRQLCNIQAPFNFKCNILSNSSKFYLRFCGNLVGKLFKLLTPKHLGHTQLTYHTTISDLSVHVSS